MEVTINILELASTLAHERLINDLRLVVGQKQNRLWKNT